MSPIRRVLGRVGGLSESSPPSGPTPASLSSSPRPRVMKAIVLWGLAALVKLVKGEPSTDGCDGITGEPSTDGCAHHLKVQESSDSCNSENRGMPNAEDLSTPVASNGRLRDEQKGLHPTPSVPLHSQVLKRGQKKPEDQELVPQQNPNSVDEVVQATSHLCPLSLCRHGG
ncbi:hypothetical protein SKAU_G00247250 [Synaphobranchus kaupii]|uniref:Uncharacterized protein n=1 Tax=Synaphobranchus kaupii TaxID=118154 RepID=A0A9Q1IRI5_SYNKA|nr:hypothetical protein SKAU_G00247250 [Synaphobranchus kaupii]